MDTRTKRVFKFIFATLFVDLLAFTLILPLLPKILDYYAANDESGCYKLFNDNVQVLQDIIKVPESHNRVLLAGILGSWFSLLQFISSPILGAISDKVGRKPILILSMLGSVFSYVIWYASSKNFALFILSRTLGGLSKANVGLSLAIISDVSNDESRGKGMAVVGTSFSLAFITGPLLGAYLASSAQGFPDSQLITRPALIATSISLIDLMLVFLFIEETNLKTIKTHNKNSKSSPYRRSESLLSKILDYVNPYSLFNFNLVRKKTRSDAPLLREMGFIYFFYLLFYSGLEFTLSFLTHLRFGFSSMEQGKLYLFSGILMALIQGGYIRRMKAGRESLIALIGLSVVVPAFVVIGIASSVSHVYYSLILYAFSSAVVVPCITTIVSTHSPSNARGATMGTLRSIGALARAVGPFLSSLMFWTVGPMYCYLLGALALLLPLYSMIQFHSHSKRSESLNRNKPETKLARLAKPS